MWFRRFSFRWSCLFLVLGFWVLDLGLRSWSWVLGLGLGLGSSWLGVAIGRSCLLGICSGSLLVLGLGLGSWVLVLVLVLARIGWVCVLVPLVSRDFALGRSLL